MSTVAAQEIKRRGISAVDSLLGQGPVHVIKNNQLSYVIMKEHDYATMLEDLALARIAASERDIKDGRTIKGSARDLMAEINNSADIS